MPAGPRTDNFQLTLFVQVFDDSKAITVFTLPIRVVVEVDAAALTNLISSITSGSTAFLDELRSSDTVIASSKVMSLTSMFTSAASSGNTSNTTNGTISEVKNFKANLKD